MTRSPRVALFTREYPPDVYGGAGVYADQLSRALARRTHVEVSCFGAPRDPPPGSRVARVRGFSAWEALARDAALQTMSVDLAMAAGVDADADVVHSNTWYTNLAGHLAKQLHGAAHVATTHSLEPLRPWKADQLGSGGYALSRFCERTGLEEADAVIAVSSAMRDDVLRVYPAIGADRVEVVHNGIDPDVYRPDERTDALARHGIDPDRPYVLFVGRVTRQKGIAHLLAAAPAIRADAQIVLCAGAADDPSIERDVAAALERARAAHRGIVWVPAMLRTTDVVQLLSQATVFCCPSVYEPFGIVNVEAMACGCAVVASDAGGIPEVVADGETGILVPLGPRHAVTGEPADARGFAGRLADALNDLLDDPTRARALGDAGRRRVLRRFTWDAAADATLGVYRRVLSG